MLERLPFHKPKRQVRMSEWSNGRGGLVENPYLKVFQAKVAREMALSKPTDPYDKEGYARWRSKASENYRIAGEMRDHWFEWVHNPKFHMDLYLPERANTVTLMTKKEKKTITPSYPLTYTHAVNFYHRASTTYNTHQWKEGLMIGFIRDLIKEEEEKAA